MPTISPVFRITVGLLLLTISILLIGDMLGLVPNQNQSKIDARKTMAESLAIQVSSEVAQGRIENAKALLEVIVKRNDDIRSAALRENSKKIVMQTEKHAAYWVMQEDDRSTITNVQVPIFEKDKRWGALEVSFTPLDATWVTIFKGQSFITMLLFLATSGLITYWLYLKRVLKELDPSAVIPDRVRTALDVLTEGLVILDKSERIVFTNKAFRQKSVLSEEELIGKSFSSLAWEMEKDSQNMKNKKFPWSYYFETKEIPPQSQLKFNVSNDETLTLDINIAPILAPNQKVKGVVVTIDDITELEKKNSELAYLIESLAKSKEEISRQNLELIELATRDPLTSLLNRRSLFEGFNSLLAEAKAQAQEISCIILDIDHFKSVNDNYGHGVGDNVIKLLATILQESVRENDLAGRYGGEEFVVVLPGMSEAEAAKVAERIRLRICQEVHAGIPEGLSLSSSFGVACTTSGVWQSDILIDMADKALYVAKESGRNRVIRHSQLQSDGTVSVATIEKPAVSQTTSVTKVTQPKESTQSKIIEPKSIDKPQASDHTSVLSRVVIMDRLLQSIKHANRYKHNVIVLTIHIETFKEISNTHGFHAAEKVRKIAYDRLKNSLRASDSLTTETDADNHTELSRIEDNEFIAILSGLKDPAAATWIAERMLEVLSEPIEIEGDEIVLSAKAGGSVYPADGERPETLLKNSSMALQKVMKESTLSFLFYDEEMNAKSKYELELKSQLHQALKREEFYLDYQPILNLKAGKVEKFESLIRWKHPKFGLVSPEDFIQVAEKSGLIKEIGKWIFDKAARQLKAWQMNGYPSMKMTINLSAVQFNAPNLAEEIIDMVQEIGVSPKSIVLELTETVLLTDYSKIAQTLLKLDAIGFKIALDDFGTGYSSIEHLQKFPISLIKIDRSLMADFPNDTQDISIVSTLIDLAHNLGISVITEGVENASQLALLRDLGCEEIQGYYINRPLSVKEANEFLRSNSAQQIMKKLNMHKQKTEPVSLGISLSEILNTPENVEL
jgi:diguanylate cyclase (GGDEF)-like protein/PAS domain S-box-containing protein